MLTVRLLALTVFILIPGIVISQDSTSSIGISRIPSKYFEDVSQKAKNLQQKLDEKTNKYLSKLRKQEEKLYKKLCKKDSIAAKQIFGDIQERYNSLQTTALDRAKKLGAFSKVYSSKLDSLNAAFNFLNSTSLLNSELQSKLKDGLKSFNSFQEKLDQTDQIKKLLKEKKKKSYRTARKIWFIKGFETIQ